MATTKTLTSWPVWLGIAVIRTGRFLEMGDWTSGKSLLKVMAKVLNLMADFWQEGLLVFSRLFSPLLTKDLFAFICGRISRENFSLIRRSCFKICGGKPPFVWVSAIFLLFPLFSFEITGQLGRLNFTLIVSDCQEKPRVYAGRGFVYEVSIKDFNFIFSFLRLYALLFLCA